MAKSLAKYLESHPDLAQKCSQSGQLSFYTTDNPQAFELQASTFFGEKIAANHTVEKLPKISVVGLITPNTLLSGAMFGKSFC